MRIMEGSSAVMRVRIGTARAWALLTVFSPRRIGLNPGAAQMEFLIDEVLMGQISP